MTLPLEHRIREAMSLSADIPVGPGHVDIEEAIEALGVILAECLAYVPEYTAADVLERILACRREWLMHPRVLEQVEPEGRA